MGNCDTITEEFLLEAADLTRSPDRPPSQIAEWIGTVRIGRLRSSICGAERNRTADLFVANEAL